ncbi:hypothetical protein [Mucilaginibacter lacusdianchii]|uniref:hypothetical protein n=1 Tax=Mucilaginibacter lacusdianchii TaxID=2684211 RepID=UPI00131E955B|nr:hypothetical protein [Mucilaginibacter sp. JXJ CY 39]
MSDHQNKEVKSQEDILADMKRLSEEVKKNVANQQLLNFEADLGEEDLETSYENDAPNLVANPDVSHRLWYTMQQMMINNLPRIDNRKPMTLERKKSNDVIKDFNSKIFAEKSLFLNRGKEVDKNGRRGSDQRQAYIPDFLKIAYDIVVKWVAQGASPMDLFLAFYDLNVERGYRKEGRTTNSSEDQPA